MAFIWIVLMLTTVLDMEVHQIDIKRVYLNIKLSDNKIIYIR